MGALELLILLAIILLVFGAKRVSQLGRSQGKGVQEFRKGVAEAESDADDDAVEMQARETNGRKKASPPFGPITHPERVNAAIEQYLMHTLRA